NEPDPRPGEDFLPETIAHPLFSEGFLTSSFKEIKHSVLREVVLMELLRVVNASLSADDLLHQSLEKIGEGTVRAKRYLELGLQYLSDGKLEAGTEWLEKAPLTEVYRLGFLILHDLVKVADQLRELIPTGFFGSPDSEILAQLKGRHPELDKS